MQTSYKTFAKQSHAYKLGVLANIIYPFLVTQDIKSSFIAAFDELLIQGGYTEKHYLSSFDLNYKMLGYSNVGGAASVANLYNIKHGNDVLQFHKSFDAFYNSLNETKELIEINNQNTSLLNQFYLIQSLQMCKVLTGFLISKTPDAQNTLSGLILKNAGQDISSNVFDVAIKIKSEEFRQDMFEHVMTNVFFDEKNKQILLQTKLENGDTLYQKSFESINGQIRSLDVATAPFWDSIVSAEKYNSNYNKIKGNVNLHELISYAYLAKSALNLSLRSLASTSKFFEKKKDKASDDAKLNSSFISSIYGSQAMYLEDFKNSIQYQREVDTHNFIHGFINNFIENSAKYFSAFKINSDTTKDSNAFKLLKDNKDALENNSKGIEHKMIGENKKYENIKELIKHIKECKNERASHSYHDKNSVLIKNYKLKIDGKEIVSLDNLELQAGSFYALKGKNANQFILDLGNILHNPYSSEGEFVQKENAKIAYASERMTKHYDATLLESIVGSKNKDKKEGSAELVKSLLKELEIGHLEKDLDSKKYSLSTADEKKVQLISLILNQSDVIVMDHLCSFMNPKDIALMHSAIEKHLNNSVVLLLDDESFKDINFKDSLIDLDHYEVSTIG
jgi:ABC-type lipopolysaccharide export system ATPase subunit